MALRFLVGASYLDIAVLFGVGRTTVFNIVWDVIDAINKNRDVGRFLFPTEEFDCRNHAARFKVGFK